MTLGQSRRRRPTRNIFKDPAQAKYAETTAQDIADIYDELKSDSGGIEERVVALEGLNIASNYIMMIDRKTAGTDGGDFIRRVWTIRDLTAKLIDNNNLCELSSNQFKLAAGAYIIKASAPAYRVNAHQIRLRNVTDDIVIASGSSERSSALDATQTRSSLYYVFEIGNEKELAIEHVCNDTQAGNGLGFNVDTGLGGVVNVAYEVYTIVELWKIA